MAADQVLFDRTARVTVNTVRFTTLDFAFKIEKSTKHEPNKCELRMWNLNEFHRAMFEQLSPRSKWIAKGQLFTTDQQRDFVKTQFLMKTVGVACQIEAGYAGDNESIWLGDLRSCITMREGPDWVTTLESGDGEKAYQNARVNDGFGPGAPVDGVIRTMLGRLNIGEGNLNKVLPKLRVAAFQMYPRGTVFTGPAAQELTMLCKSADLEWSIQNKKAQFMLRGQPVQGTAIHITPETGMLDSPSVDEEGNLACRILMTKDVYPGRLIKVDAARVKGAYRITRCTYTGDTAGGDWTIDIEADRFTADGKTAL